MKPMLLTIVTLLFVLTNGYTTSPASGDSAQSGPVTVHVTYRVLPGKEAQFRATLSRAWKAYRRDNLVSAKPHILLQDVDEDKKPRFVEIFSWANQSIADHPTANVWAVWRELHTLCENRNERPAIHAEKVKLVSLGN